MFLKVLEKCNFFLLSNRIKKMEIISEIKSMQYFNFNTHER